MLRRGESATTAHAEAPNAAANSASGVGSEGRWGQAMLRGETRSDMRGGSSGEREGAVYVKR